MGPSIESMLARRSSSGSKTLLSFKKIEFHSPDKRIKMAGFNQNRLTKEKSGSEIRTAWLPLVDTFRTLCVAPPPAVKRLFDGVRQLAA